MQFTLIYRESGNGLTIGAGPGTGTKIKWKAILRLNIPVGNLDYLSRRSVFSLFVCSFCFVFGNFPVGQAKIALPFTV